MKVCFLLADITCIGGVERVTSVLSSFLSDECGMHIDIVSQFKGREASNYPLSNNISVRYLKSRPKGGKSHSYMQIFNWLKNRKSIRNFFRDNRYDIIVTQSFPNTLLMYLSGCNMENVVAVEHTYYGYYDSLTNYVRQYIYKKVRRVVVLTEKDKDCFEKHLPIGKIVAIANPINISESHGHISENKRIISVGRLHPAKGYDNLIRIFKNVHQCHPDWTLDIYGMGVLHDELQQQINDAGLTDALRLCGITNHIENVMHEYAFMVSTSHYEGFSMCLVEAMNQQLPVVSFDCPNGPSTIITNGVDGILVPNQDMIAMEKTINWMIEHPIERKQMGAKGPDNLKRFSIQEIGWKWKELLYAIMDEIDVKNNPNLKSTYKI